MNKLLSILSVIVSIGFINATGQFFGDFNVANGQPLHFLNVHSPGQPYIAEPHDPTYQFGGYPDPHEPGHVNIACGPEDGPLQAIAVLKSETVNGNVTLTQKSCTDALHIEVSLVGLSPGFHGFHVHEKGDLSGGCGSTGGHYNPDKLDHGDIHDQVRHVGDWANVEANEAGVVSKTFTDTVATLYGPRSILGRAIVVHEKVDDLGKTDHPDSRKTGNAGGRLACGVIGILLPYEANWPGSGSQNTIVSVWTLILSFFTIITYFK